MTLETLKTLCAYIDTPADMVQYLTPWRGAKAGNSPLILFPTTTQQVADIIKTCAASRIPLVPMGGNTGLVQGTLTDGEVIVNLSRMNKVREIDPVGYTITLEAGCILQHAQEAAKQQQRLFPLSMASEGSCEIGGNLATNAGGINVLRYGTTRELCLGLEAVMADGSIYHGLKTLRKDNTGYDLKSLLIGSEGTLGIITAATFKLFPLPAQTQTALLAIPHADAALKLLALFREHSGDAISAFEYIADSALQLVLAHIPGTRAPFDTPSPAYVLVELTTSAPGDYLRGLAEAILAEAFERGLVTDGALAENLNHAQDFWKLRESISDAARSGGHGLHFDISLPLIQLPGFLEKTDSVIRTAAPNVKLITFGHFGDGNLHYNMLLPDSTQDATIKQLTYANLQTLGGSISAEHGIGLLRKTDLATTMHKTELTLMHSIKQALDPMNLLNPGKLI